MPRRDRRESPRPPAKGTVLELDPHDAWQVLSVLLMSHGRVMVPEDLFTQPRHGAIVVFRDTLAKTVTFRLVDENEDWEANEEFGAQTIVWTAPKVAFRPLSSRTPATGKTPGRRNGGRTVSIGKGA